MGGCSSSSRSVPRHGVVTQPNGKEGDPRIVGGVPEADPAAVNQRLVLDISIVAVRHSSLDVTRIAGGGGGAAVFVLDAVDDCTARQGIERE